MSNDPNRRNFLKQLGLLLGSSTVASVGGLNQAQAFIAKSMRRARVGIPTLFGWGNNYSKILSVSPAGNVSSPAFANTKVWAKIVADYNYQFGITTDGALWYWGNDGDGMYVHGNGIHSLFSSPVRLGSALWQDIAILDSGALAIKTDGTLWGWGTNSVDIFPTNSSSDVQSAPVYIASGDGNPWLSVSMNNNPANLNYGTNTVVVRNGGLYGFGANESFQLALGFTGSQASPVQLPFAAKYASMGKTHAMGIASSGHLVGWGLQTSGAIGSGVTSATAISTPIQTGSGITTWTAVACGNNCSVMLLGNVMAFTGDSTYGTSGMGTATISTPTQVGTISTWSKISLSERHVLATRTNGTLWAWGTNTSGAVGTNSAAAYFSTPVQVGAGTTWSSVSAGYNSSLAIQSDGSLWAWGENSEGQLGIGTTTSVSSPVRVGTGTWLKANTSTSLSVGVKTGGTLWVWGFTGPFMSTGIASTPIQIGSETNWADVYCGYQCLVVIKSDLSIWSMGTNYFSQLGNSPALVLSTPVQMGSATNWKKIAAKDFTGVVALKTDNTLWNWGWLYPAPNQAYASYRLKTPVQVGTGTDWTDIDSSSGNMMARKSNGTLWAWGLAREKSGWSGSQGDTSTPVQVGTATTWTSFSLGQTAAFGVQSNGTLWSWGNDYNGFGQLGQAGNPILSPKQVGAMTNWASVTTRNFTAYALKTDNTLWGWGYNAYGNLGTNDLSNRSSPVQITTAGKWTQIFAGMFSAFGVRKN